jgi:hypothetical protein
MVSILKPAASVPPSPVPSVGHDYGQPCDAAEPGIEGVGGRADVANYMLRAIGKPETFRQTVGIAN